MVSTCPDCHTACLPPHMASPRSLPTRPAHAACPPHTLITTLASHMACRLLSPDHHTASPYTHGSRTSRVQRFFLTPPLFLYDQT